MKKNDNQEKLIISYEPIPTVENINYVFQRLVTPIISATGFTLYENSHDKFINILNKVMNWIIIYANKCDLSQINWDEFIEVRQQLFELDSKYSPVDGCYAEEAYEWALQLQILLEKVIKERHDKNAI